MLKRNGLIVRWKAFVERIVIRSADEVELRVNFRMPLPMIKSDKWTSPLNPRLLPIVVPMKVLDIMEEGAKQNLILYIYAHKATDESGVIPTAAVIGIYKELPYLFFNDETYVIPIHNVVSPILISEYQFFYFLEELLPRDLDEEPNTKVEWCRY